MTISRRAAGLTTQHAANKAATRHARLTLLTAAHTVRTTTGVERADARTTMCDARAALDAIRGTS